MENQSTDHQFWMDLIMTIGKKEWLPFSNPWIIEDGLIK
jgi:hypothetical protein